MNYQKIYKFDLANGLGARIAIFVSGCTLHCEGCFNSEAWDFDSGKPFTSEEYFKILNILKHPYYDGLSILGGEPFDQHPDDIKYLINLCMSAHALNKDVWIWSGHCYEELVSKSQAKELLENCDILIDGNFIEEQKDLSLTWRGSSNQRIIDVQKSLEQNQVVLYNN